MKILRLSGLIVFLFSFAVFTWFRISEVKSSDTTGPVFDCKADSLAVSVKTTEEDLLEGITAYDQKDGDVTDTIMIEKLSGFITAEKRKLTYAAYDSSNNVTKYERELTYTDYTPPRFSITKPFSFSVSGQDSITGYLTATDCIDGDLTDKITYEAPNEIMGQSVGTYEVKFFVTNSAGDTACLPVTVEYHYTDADNADRVPEIELSDYLIYIKTGTAFNPRSFLKGVKIGAKQYSIQTNQSIPAADNVISQDRITVKSGVNQKEPGVYEVNYSMTEDGFQGTTKLLVVVEE